MGLLEDAIKEHLELKKAHGADESEVKHEAEAVLGDRAEVPEPVEPPAPPSPAPEPVTEVPEPADQPASPAPVPEPVADAAAPIAEFTEPVKHENLFGEEAALPRPTDTGQTDDLLEATPEFFQETPEYDRLWFEEKAPKDFNFDS